MALNKDFIPEADWKFQAWLSNFVCQIAAVGPAHYRIPEESFNKIKAEAGDFDHKFLVAVTPETRTKAAVQAKNDARKVAERDARAFIKEFLTYNSLVTDADRDTLGLPIHKTTRSKSQVADKPPHISVRGDGPRRLLFLFSESETSKAKPEGQHGLDLVLVISDTAPASYDELTSSMFSTHSPLIWTFPLAYAGRRVFFAARWQNTRGEKGPWTEIQSAIIP